MSQQDWTASIQEFQEMTRKFYAKEISVKDYKGFSGFFGSYAQRGGNASMLRLRMAGGQLTKERLAFLTSSIRTHQINKVHFTTCQTVQLHNLDEKAVCALVPAALDHGIIVLGGGGDFPRNVMASPLSGVEQGEYFDVLPCVQKAADYLLSLLLQLLPEHRAVALEDPGYPAAYAAAALHGRQAVPIPVDGEGMDPDALECSGAGLAYVTPSHQFPLGVTMPAGRRSRLLHWAASQPGRFLIEDDYDSEFRYASRPIPALQGLDRAGRVVYMGTFSRSIAPAIRVAYMILPPQLLERYRRTFSHGACTVSRFEQESLRRFIAQGLYGRHLRRTGNLYRRKCALLTQALSAIPGAAISGGDAGLHFLLTLPRYSEGELVERAAAQSVRVHPLSRYCHAVPPLPSTVVLGFAGLTGEELSGAAERLRAAWI